MKAPQPFSLWRLQWKKDRLYASFLRRIVDADKQKNTELWVQLLNQRRVEIDRIDDSIEYLRTRHLLRESEYFDLAIPDRNDVESWKDRGGIFVFTPAARLRLRRLIDEEKGRRREVAAWWWKTIILPVLTFSIGVIGAVTGLVAVWKKH